MEASVDVKLFACVDLQTYSRLTSSSWSLEVKITRQYIDLLRYDRQRELCIPRHEKFGKEDLFGQCQNANNERI